MNMDSQGQFYQGIVRHGSTPYDGCLIRDEQGHWAYNHFHGQRPPQEQIAHLIDQAKARLQEEHPS